MTKGHGTAHHDSIGLCTIAPAVIGGAASGLDKFELLVKIYRRLIVRCDLKKGGFGVCWQRVQPVFQQLLADSLALMAGINGQRQQLAFACQRTGERKAGRVVKAANKAVFGQFGELLS